MTHARPKAVARGKRAGASRPATRIETERSGTQPALEENIKTIRNWERASVHHRSRVEQLSDEITRIAAGGPVLLIHLGWFTFWILANTGLLPGIAAFDPFPFPLLTTAVSLEAIFLSLFVLASQNRLTAQADKRANLDLQIDLLAEREMTVILRLLQDIARDLNVRLSVTPDQIRDLVQKTDIHTLTHRMDELSPDASSQKRHERP